MLTVLGIFCIIATLSIGCATAKEFDYGDFTLDIDSLSNSATETNFGFPTTIDNHLTHKGNVSVMVMNNTVDPDTTIKSFIEDDGFKEIEKIGDFTLFDTGNGEYEGVYFADDYWVAIIFEDLDSGKDIIKSFKKK